MVPEPTSLPALLARADALWAQGDGPSAIAVYQQALAVAEAAGDVEASVTSVLGLARGQQFNVAPGLLPVQLHTAYDATAVPASKARLAAALARCWAYAQEPQRAQPFAAESLELAGTLADPVLEADALDAVLAAHWGPDDLDQRRGWALRLGDVAAHQRDPDARLQAALWGLTVAWEVLDLPRMHRSMRMIELLAEESPRAAFFAASRRLPLELLRGNNAASARLIAQAEAAAASTAIPDAHAVLYAMRGYSALFSGDSGTCAALAPVFEEYAIDNGVVAVRAEGAVIWLGAGRPDKVAELVGAFTPTVLRGLPRDSDWLLTMQCVLEAAIALRDQELTASVIDLLEPYPGRSVVNGGALMWHGVTSDTLARAHWLQGDAEAAARHRAAALTTYERLNARWWADRLRASGPPGPAHGAVGARVVHLHRQTGGLWIVGQNDHAVALPAMRGLAHLHTILSNPRTDLAAIDLAGGGEAILQGGLDVLDDQARQAYRQRLAYLDEMLADSDRPDLHHERDAIAAELGSASGLAGRVRRTGGHDERARVAVRKAIVAALARIAENDPWLARYLNAHVRTGSHCRYDPDPDQPVVWVLREASGSGGPTP